MHLKQALLRNSCGAEKPVAHYSGSECATRNGSFGLLRGSELELGWGKEGSAGYLSVRLSILFVHSLQKFQWRAGGSGFPRLLAAQSATLPRLRRKGYILSAAAAPETPVSGGHKKGQRASTRAREKLIWSNRPQESLCSFLGEHEPAPFGARRRA